jgi:hypothetical protein
MVKPPLRTKSIGFKVSEEEYAQLEAAAQASGQTLGEWCREVVLASGQETEPASSPTKPCPRTIACQLCAEFIPATRAADPSTDCLNAKSTRSTWC